MQLGVERSLNFYHPSLDLNENLVKMINMTSEFDWFMITMPLFALMVWAIVMVGSMEKQPKFLDGAMAKRLFGVVFIGFFGIGILVSFYYMLLRFYELLGNY